MFIGPNLWNSNYKARTEQSSVEYILSSHFDDIFIADLKETFENCLRVDSQNSLVAPFNFTNYRAVNLSAPVQPKDAANKQYVDDSVYKFESVIVVSDPVFGDYNLQSGKIYSMSQGGAALNFILPTPTNLNVLNQIMVDIKTNDEDYPVYLGCSNYFDRITESLVSGNFYTIIYEYSNQMQDWVVGVIQKGTGL